MLIIFSLADAISSPSSLLTDANYVGGILLLLIAIGMVYIAIRSEASQKLTFPVQTKNLVELSKLNFSSFPNLVELDLAGCRLNGSCNTQEFV